MSHRRVVVAILACALPVLAGCGKLADALGAPNRGVTKLTVVLPQALLVGDTVQARVVALNGKGLPPAGDSTITWRSSDPAAVSVDARGRVSGATTGAHATISAQMQGVTGSVDVSVADDQRLGYALVPLANQSGPYTADPAFSFNSSGAAITLARQSAGNYTVTFMGLGRQAGQRDNVQVTAYGGAGGVFCKLSGWQTVGSDLSAGVLCLTPTGTPADSRFTILLSGARVYNTSSRLGFALSPDFGGVNSSVSFDTSGTTRNNSARTVVNFGRTGPGAYAVQFPGLERIAGTPGQGPETIQVTAVGVGPERCHVSGIDVPNAGIGVSCTGSDGAPAESRFSILWFQRGRRTLRFGYALADQPASTIDYAPTPSFLRNPGGSVTARETATGQYRIVFQGLARGARDTETVLLTPVGNDHLCATTSSGNTGTTDFAVTIACYNDAGLGASTQFNVLIVE